MAFGRVAFRCVTLRPAEAPRRRSSSDRSAIPSPSVLLSPCGGNRVHYFKSEGKRQILFGFMTRERTPFFSERLKLRKLVEDLLFRVIGLRASDRE